jgi:hypothetical protein
MLMKLHTQRLTKSCEGKENTKAGVSDYFRKFLAQLYIVAPQKTGTFYYRTKQQFKKTGKIL